MLLRFERPLGRLTAFVAAASVAPRAQGAKVEVEALRSETSSTWVNPDGSLTTDQHLGSIRFHDGAGGETWT